MHTPFNASGTVIAGCKSICTKARSTGHSFSLGRTKIMCAGAAASGVASDHSKLQRLYEVTKASIGSGMKLNDESVGQIRSSLGEFMCLRLIHAKNCTCYF